MSWSMWHVYGIGMDVAAVDEKKLKGFLEKHKASLADYARQNGVLGVLKEYDEDPECDWNLCDEIAEATDNGTIGEVIAHIIRKETNVTFISPGLTDNGDDPVLFTPAYPWEMSHLDSTIQDVKGVYKWIQPYAEELDVKNTLSEYDLIYSG